MRARTLFTALLLLVLTVSCGRAAHEAETVAGHVPREVPHAPPRAVEPPRGHSPVEIRKAEILQTVDDLPAQDRTTVIEAACKLYSIYGLSQITDKDEFVRKTLYEVGGDHTKAGRAIEFFNDLKSDSTPEDIRNSIAVAVCGW